MRIGTPFWQAANPSPSATWVLPVPDGPTAKQPRQLLIKLVVNWLINPLTFLKL